MRVRAALVECTQNSAGSGRATHYERTNGGAQAPGQRSRPTALERTSSIRCHHRIKTFHGGPGGWRDEQLPDGTIVWTSPTGRIYRTTPGGPELFPQMRPACGTNAAQAQPVEGERGPDCPRCNKIREQRPVNAEQRRVNRARRQEIADRKWRNHMRKMLVLFKGSEPSTSPRCTWVNDPFEPEELPPDWKPPPPPQPLLDDAPPF